MKILFLGDYSNFHGTLAREMKRRGHEATLVSDGGWHMKTPTDVYLHREPGLLGGFKYFYQVMSLLPELKGYDVVQLINPHFLRLKPGKLQYIFKELKRNNGAICLTLAGNDHFFVKSCLEEKYFPYSEFRIKGEKTRFARENPKREEGYMLPSVEAFTENLYLNIDAAMSTLYEYHLPVEEKLGNRLYYTGLPVDLEKLRYSTMPQTDKVNLFIGMRDSMVVQKGTGLLLDMARSLETELPGKVEVTTVVNLTFDDYIRAMQQAHIVLDQLYAPTPALNALDAMALGRVAASGAEPAFYDFIGETDLRPIVRLSPLREDIREELKTLIEDRDLLEQRGRQSREFVEKHNDVRLVADRFEQAWRQRGR